MSQSGIKTGAELSAPESQLITRAIREVVEERERATLRMFDSFLRLRCAGDILNTGYVTNRDDLFRAMALFDMVRRTAGRYAIQSKSTRFLIAGAGAVAIGAYFAHLAAGSVVVIGGHAPVSMPAPIARFAIMTTIQRMNYPSALDIVISTEVSETANVVKLTNAAETFVFQMPTTKVDRWIAPPTHKRNYAGVPGPHSAVYAWVHDRKETSTEPEDFGRLKAAIDLMYEKARELEKTLDGLREAKTGTRKELFTINGRITNGFPRYDER